MNKPDKGHFCRISYIGRIFTYIIRINQSYKKSRAAPILGHPRSNKNPRGPFTAGPPGNFSIKQSAYLHASQGIVNRCNSSTFIKQSAYLHALQGWSARSIKRGHIKSSAYLHVSQGLLAFSTAYVLRISYSSFLPLFQFCTGRK